MNKQKAEIRYTSAVDGLPLVDIPAEDLKMYARDPVGAIAKRLRCKKQNLVDYLDFMANGNRCTGVTRKGKQCKRTSWPDGWKRDPRTFALGIDDRCQQHVAPCTVKK